MSWSDSWAVNILSGSDSVEKLRIKQKACLLNNYPQEVLLFIHLHSCLANIFDEIHSGNDPACLITLANFVDGQQSISYPFPSAFAHTKVGQLNKPFYFIPSYTWCIVIEAKILYLHTSRMWKKVYKQ